MSKKLGIALGTLILFLAAVAFLLGRPAPRDARIYPIVQSFSPYTIKKTLGGLKILNREDPKFEEEPDAVDFYPRLHTLEREWAKKHLMLKNHTLLILDNQGKILKTLPLKNKKEQRFVEAYYGVNAQ